MKFIPYWWKNWKKLLIGSISGLSIFSLYWYFAGDTQEPWAWVGVAVLNLIAFGGCYIDWKRKPDSFRNPKCPTCGRKKDAMGFCSDSFHFEPI
jgi:O-antigen/teichoic acid export membrane protein